MSSAAPGTHPKWKTALRAGVYLLAALVPAVGLLWWNTPSAKTLEFDFVCDRFQVPMPITLNLNHAPTQLQQVVLSGFYGQVTRVATVSEVGSKPVAVPQGKLTLGRNTDPTPPYLTEVPTEGLGKMEMSAQAGVILSSLAAPGEPPSLNSQICQAGRYSLSVGEYGSSDGLRKIRGSGALSLEGSGFLYAAGQWRDVPDGCGRCIRPASEDGI